MIAVKLNQSFLDLLRCPISGERLFQKGSVISTESGSHTYRLNEFGIPLFAEIHCSEEAHVQQMHYNRVSASYLENLDYPHTQTYSAYLDRNFMKQAAGARLENVVEICCGRGEAFYQLQDYIKLGVGIDISVSMLEAARNRLSGEKFFFAQGDATMLPLADGRFDTAIILGGIHHINNRQKLFGEIFRILRPGGVFIWREPVNDFFLWRWIRSIVYRVSPALDNATETPLLFKETVPPLLKAGFEIKSWMTYGFLGFCLFMNSDVLVINRLLRHIPSVSRLTHMAVRFDDWMRNIPSFKRFGLQVMGLARRP